MTSLLEKLTKQLDPLSDTSALDAQVLLAHITQKERVWILAHPELTLSFAQEKALTKSLAQLKKNIPLPYIIGHWEFFGLDFIISPDVLIPRPETEELVERVIKRLRASKKKSILDVGTGSGCIPISIARNAPDLNLVGVDLSSAAINIACQNAEKHANRRDAKSAKNALSSPRKTWRIGSSIIQFQQSDLLSNLQPATRRAEPVEAFDLITANLPYIPTATLKTLDVYTREPTLALDGGADGLDLVRQLLADAPRYLAPKGLILLEIDSSHGQAALGVARNAFPKAENKLLQDLSGRDRFIRIQL
ncbi:MAG: peptide chain release factor N(5)-glutamine methyltransferase [Anaerolineae bacterium]|jgi:release factor glutamine methyltransferase|nr:peptide chain release factor N(5)-glutamine methyltransferase [Anaerolineae bacterium]MBT7192339.1 peptide chain release factor N(5)-glutamine methyltransferase [Anaerolineae bacterium]MBT7991687.1 peptide chain release factor N(5)-glutamine methyltransferase [Anaerolineae bacterium]